MLNMAASFGLGISEIPSSLVVCIYMRADLLLMDWHAMVEVVMVVVIRYAKLRATDITLRRSILSDNSKRMPA